MFEHYLSLFVRAVFVENMALAFFLIGLFIWAIRVWKPEQVEEDTFKMKPHTRVSDAF